VDLPTYTNIWRIEKRLYKLYDFRLPAPLPITWIGVFAGITVPYVFFLIAVGLPFNHNLVWLYVLPPGVLTWLTTRPVIENKRLPELVSSQLRYMSEPRAWCRMAPFAEKDEIMVSARVWHRHPPKAKPRKAKKSPVKVGSGAPAPQPVEAGVARAGAARTGTGRTGTGRTGAARAGASRVAARTAMARTAAARAGVRASRPQRTAARPLGASSPQAAVQDELAQPPALAPAPAAAGSSPVQVPVPERAPSRRGPKRPASRPAAEPSPQPSWSSWPQASANSATHGQDLGAETRPPAAWVSPPRPAEQPDEQEGRTLEVAHDSDPGRRVLSESSGPTAWPSPGANLLPLVRPIPEPAPFPEVGAFPEIFFEPEPDLEPGDHERSELNGGAPAGEPAADAEPDAGTRSGPASGSARWHLAGLRHGLGRKASQTASEVPSAGEPAPSAGEPAPGDDTPTPAAPDAASAWPQPLATPARAGWMLRVQSPPPELTPGTQPELAPEVRVTDAQVPGIQPPEAREPEPADTEPASTEPASTEPASTEPASTEPASTEAASTEAVSAPAASTETASPEIAGTETAETAETAPPTAPTPAGSAVPRVVGVERAERERPLPSIERALSGPGSHRDASSWHRQVKVVAGGQGPGKRDQEALDRDRARRPLAAPSLIAVLGCTRGAGQTVTALMAGHILAALRGVPVATLDLNPGPTSLSARRAPSVTLQALLSGHEARPEDPPELVAGPGPGGRLDVIASLPGQGALDGADFARLAALLTERYPLTMIDPSPAGLPRVLAAADQLILVAPASPDAATALANTQQWLGAHGHGDLAARAVTVVNGVSRRTMPDVLQAESVARGRCRAIVRVPWDDGLSVRPSSPSAGYPQATAYPQVTLQAQARLAYTALAGVLVAALAASQPGPVPGRNAGEHSD
jgi:MinD-like ATPase involved in chromosome partitioning or flagellar assembly